MNKQIGLYTKDLEPSTISLAQKIVSFLKERDVSVFAEADAAKLLNVSTLSHEMLPQLICMLSLGGDGTILRLHKRFPNCTTPVIGVNLGSLGFLADIPVTSCFESLDKILEEQYHIAPRMILEGTLQNGVMTVINEFSIHRSSSPFLIDLSIHVDGRYFNTFSADGVIISTPLGSTAYSLSAGGPIIDPDVKAIVITPICPHTISTKPVVLVPQDSITISCQTKGARAEVNYDGTVGPILSPEDTFTIRISTQTFNMIRLQESDFFSTLRTKMGWSGTFKNQLFSV